MDRLCCIWRVLSKRYGGNPTYIFQSFVLHLAVCNQVLNRDPNHCVQLHWGISTYCLRCIVCYLSQFVNPVMAIQIESV